MATFTEGSYELVLMELFRSELGYETECGYDITRDAHCPLYLDVLATYLPKINKDLADSIIADAIYKLKTLGGGTLVQNNEVFMDWLQNGMPVPYNTPEGERTATVRLVDYDNPEANDFRVVNQWTVEEYKTKRCDMVVFVNGLPLVVVELKGAMAENADIEDAYKQIRNYQQDIMCLFNYNCFNVISDLTQTKAGTITSKESRYMEWKAPQPPKGESLNVVDYHTFFTEIFRKDQFLDIIRNFTLFDKGDGTPIKIMTAYHQYYAVNKAMTRAEKAIASDGKIGVFWHTQGSGKSLSMVFFVHQLVQKVPEVTIVVVTDRKDLDTQLYGQFSRCQDFIRNTPVQAESREALKTFLDGRKAGGCIFTTIQKFEEGDGPLSERRNIVVITDEAHRSQYGDEHWDAKSQTMKKGYSQMMREALPGASFIGFTGTPISDRDRDTEEVFGDYIDIYDMSQAVQDGATRPVYYESRVVNIELNEETLRLLNDEFDALRDEGATDEQINKAKHEHSRLEALLGDDDTIDSLVHDIIKHYEDNREQVCGGKAMIVGYSRGICIKIYERILQLRPEWQEKVKVVMSYSNKDPEEWQSIIGNEAYKKELARKFKDINDPMKIAIVRDMWLTGFDVPSLATMYVFKSMSGHNLMQAIARVNRVFPEKEGGLVVDYIGIAQALKDAMKQYTARDRKAYGDPDIAKTAMKKWQEELEICRDQIHGFEYDGFFEDDNTKKATVIVDATNYMTHPTRESQKELLIEHSRALHNATTLCRSLLSEQQKQEVCFFDAVRVTLVRLSAKGPISKQEINRRISELLRQSIKAQGVINLFGDQQMEFSLFDEAFLKDVQQMKQKNLAVELLKKLLKEKIQKVQKTNVVESELFSDMLNKSLSNYIKGLLTNEEVINELVEMARKLKEAEAKGNDLGLTVEEKAFYDALSRPEGVREAYNDEEFVALTKELTDALHKNRTIDWNHKESARAKMRVMVKRLLKKYKYPPEGAQEALDVVMRQCDHWADNEDNYVSSLNIQSYASGADYRYGMVAEDGNI